MTQKMHHDNGQSRRVLARIAIAGALALAPATALVAPAFATPLVLEPADQAETPTPGTPIHGGSGSGHLSHRHGGTGSAHLSHGLPSTGSAF
ncbi:hypothetical protein AB0B25_09420 [Nocardia sp. NPDC049190]|uniref:hypothetical protein n=1 Tax=Nocardia sp. NPDC049190 TaxID=3155650 RepID=UPI0033EB58ED